MPDVHRTTSPILAAFVDGFRDRYEELRNVRPPDVLMPSRSDASDRVEMRRVYALADKARDWGLWALTRHPDEAHKRAASYARNAPPIADHHTAHDADGWLTHAAQQASGYAKIALSDARRAAQHAAEMDLHTPAPPDLEAATASARAAGSTLAAAGMAFAEIEAALAEVPKVLDDLA